ncbi:MAG: hypothetical protein IPK04_16955 [Bdellovibrionales bacterium]|jgi:hypothetical protein|nr:hypothetical protein [Bdellovibrionales bacterium]
MFEYFLDNLGISDCGNDFRFSAANIADFHVYFEDSLEQLGPKEEYDKARNFYLAIGFVPVEEFKQVLSKDAVKDEEIREWRLEQDSRCLAAKKLMPVETVFLDSGENFPDDLLKKNIQII